MPPLLICCVLLLPFVMLPAAEPSPEVTRYYEMLRSRPQPGVVFDRFTDAWLSSGTTDGLREFLEGKAVAAGATAQDHLVLALFEARQGNEPEALAAYAKALTIAPANAPAWEQRARLEMRMLDFNAALKSLDAALAQRPDEKLAVDLIKLRGRVLLRTGKPDDALQAWRDLLKAHPEDEDLAEEVVDLQLGEGLPTEGAETMRALIARTKDTYVAVGRKLRLADILLRAGKKSEALAQLNDCLSQSGRDTWIESETLAQIDRVFRRDDNITGLADYLEKLASGDASRVAALSQLARVQAETGNREKALATYAALLARTPGRRDLRESYLDLLERFEKYPDAIAQTKLLIEQNAGDKDLQLRLAGLQQQSGNAKGADEALAVYLEAKGTTEFDHLRIARLLEQWGRKADAKAAYERMVAAYPENTSAREAQAQFLHRTGDLEGAFAIWRDLAAKGGLEQLLTAAQALLTRLEPKTALEVLRAREKEFGQEPRFLTPLITAAIAMKEHAAAAPWALARVRLTTETTLLDDAIRQTMEVLEGAKIIETSLKDLKTIATPSLSERALLAALLEKWGDGGEAEKLLRDAPANQAVAAQARLVRLFESRRDWPRAAAELEKLIARPEGRTSQHMQQLVDVKQRSGEPDAALKLIADWKTLSPGAVQPWLTEAAILSQLSRLKEAVEVLRAASRKFEDDENVMVALANAYADANRFADAEQLLLKLVEKEENLDDKLRWVAGLAQMAYTRNMVKPVLEKFQERQRTNHADAMPWLALAEIHKASSNKTEQRICLVEALRLRPKDIGLMHEIARVDEDNGDWKGALRMLEQAAGLDPTPRSRQLVAVLQLRWGDEQSAFQTLIDLSGGLNMGASDAMRIADAMAAREMWAKAAQFLEPLVERMPADYRLRYFRAMALNEDGKRTEAVDEFLQIALSKEELPEALKKRSADAARTAATMARYLKLYPPGTRQLMDITQSGYSALQLAYRRQYRSSSVSGTSNYIPLPQTVEQARTFALVHLVVLLREAKPEVRARVSQTLRDGGVEHADSLLALEQHPQSSYMLTISEDSLRARPNDEALHGLWIMTAARGEQVVLDPALCRRTYELFKEKFPRVALAAVHYSLRSDLKGGLAMLEETVGKLETAGVVSEEDLGMSAYYLSMMLGGGQRINMDTRIDSIPEPLRKRICQILLKAGKVQSDGLMPYVSYAANGLRAEGDWEQYVKFWDEYFAAFHKADPAQRKTMTAPPRVYTSLNNVPALLGPLEFPPVCAAMPTLFAMSMRYQDPMNTHIESYRRAGPEAEYEPVAKFLGNIKDPVLRMVLAYKSSQSARAEAELTKLLASPQVGTDELLLAASFYSSSGQHARAVEYLLRCATSRMEAAQRSAVDAALVHEVTNLSEPQRKALGGESLVAAQQAVRRLRTSRLPAEQQQELVNALTTLGLKEEAEQWRRIAALTPPSSSRSSVSRSVSSSSGSSASVARIRTLASKGDQDGAMRLAITELRSILAQYGDSSETQAKRLAVTVVSALSFPDAKKKLVTAITPVDGTGDAKILEAGRILEILDERQKARELYVTLTDRNPNYGDARVRLMLLGIQDSSDANAIAQLEQASWRDLAKGAGDQLAYALRSGEKVPFAARMRMLSVVAQYLEKLAASNDPPQRGGLEWTRALVDAVATYDNGARIPNLYEKSLSPYSSYRNAGANELKLRREVHDALCMALIKHPSVADSGFRGLAGMALRENGPSEELVTLATKILKEQAEEIARGPALPSPPPFRRYIEDPTRYVWRPTPGEFLMWHAWKEGKPERIASEIMPLAERATNPTGARLLRAGAELWTCEPARFGETANEFVRLSNTGQSMPYISRAELDVVERWTMRKLSPDAIETFVINRLKNGNNPFFFSEGGLLSPFLMARARLHGAEGLDEFVARLTRELLGVDWKKKIAAVVGTRSSNYSSRDMAAMLMYSVNGMLRDPEGYAVGVRIAMQLGMTENSTWRSSYLNTSNLLSAQKPDTAVTFLKVTPFVGEADTFQPWSTDPTGEKTTLMEQFFSSVRLSPIVRDAVQAHLAKEPRTFGAEFCEAMLKINPAAPLSAMLKKRAADVGSVPVERRAEIGAMLMRLIPALKQPATADPVLKKTLEPLMAGQFKKEEDRLNLWMKARLASELKLTDADFEAELLFMLKDLAVQDRAKARELFLHACAMMEAKEKQTQWTTRNAGNGWLLRSYIVEQAMKDLPKMEMLGLAMQLYHDDITGNLTMSGWSQSTKWGNALMEVWKSAGGQGDLGRGLQAMTERTQKELGKTPPTLLAVAFYDLFAKLPQSYRVPALKWAENQQQDATLAPIIKELAMAGRFFLATDTASRGNAAAQKALEELGGLAPLWAHAEAKMKDESINPRVRQSLGHHYCYRAPLAVTPQVVKASAALALQSMKQGHCIHGFQHGWIMQAFSRLPVDDAWKGTAQEQWEAWIGRVGKSASSPTLAYQPCDWALHNMLLMSGRAGREEWIQRIFANYGATLGNEPSALAVLVAGGRPREAVNWVKEHWKICSHTYENGLQWSAQVQAGLPAFREACESPDLALLGEIMLAKLPDPPKQDHASIPGFLDRNKRLAAVAAKLPGTKFADDAMRTRCLEYLGEEFDTHARIAKEYDEVASRTDLIALAEVNDSTLRAQKLRPLLASVGRKMGEGSAQTAIEAYDKAINSPNPNRNTCRYVARELATGLFAAATYKMARNPKADWRPLLAFVDHVLAKTPSEMRDSQMGQAAELKLLLHLAQGENDALAKWRDNLTVDQSQTLEKEFGAQFDVWTRVRDFAGQPKMRLPVEQRAALVAVLLKDNWMARRYPDAGTGLTNLMNPLVTKSKLFTVDEFVIAWKPIAEASPRKGRTAGESADLLIANNKLAEALPAFDLAISQMEKDPAAANGFKYRKAELLERMNRKDEARTLLESLDPKKLSPAIRGPREAMLKRLGA
jgi:tetratricopeptide (TPR) repeat protein